jgi:Mrp family chromosome partitioning ATPase
MQELTLHEKTILSPVMKDVYRRIRTNIEFTGIDNKVICLTSCAANDGKTSVSFNLANYFAAKYNGNTVSSVVGGKTQTVQQIGVSEKSVWAESLSCR